MTNRKNPKRDLRRYRGLFFNIGLVVSLGIILTAFEWKTPLSVPESHRLDIPEVSQLIDIPVTNLTPPPPPPKIRNPVFKEVKNDVKLTDIKVIVDLNPEVEVSTPVYLPEPPPEEPEVIFTIVEDQPTFMNGGQEAFLKYIGSHLKYPAQAKRMGIEGKVFVQFVVDKDGKMTDIEVVRGIGAGCDEEVLRVLKDAPAWQPGKQRGVPVKVRMIVPVSFKLN